MDIEISISRIYQPDCTLGIMNHRSGFRCCSLELPWLNNQKNISCVPAGIYECFKRHSNNNGDVFELRNVINRTFIQCHSANFTRQIKGCIIVGDSFTDIDKDGILDVTNSKTTHKKLMSLLPEKFLLEIK